LIRINRDRALAPSLALRANGGPKEMDMMWDGWGGYGMGWFGLMHLVWWLVLIVGAAALMRMVLRPGTGRATGEDRARIILRERYARGEIGQEEFSQRMQHLKA
jgi:putative membrane protein